MRPECTVAGCDQPQHGQDLCDKHYQRLRHRGDPVDGTRAKVPNGTKCVIDGCDRPHWRREHCRPHYHRLLKYGDPLAGPALPELVDIDGKRLCTKCRQRKPLDEFDASSTGRGGKARNCKTCVKLRSDTWYQANREAALAKGRLAHIRRQYGEAGFEVAKRRDAGDGCDACGQRAGRMVIDHCHETGSVRGLLCSPCNLILGAVGDSPERLRSLALYLDGYLFLGLPP